jgi:hypothetical protein
MAEVDDPFEEARRANVERNQLREDYTRMALSLDLCRRSYIALVANYAALQDNYYQLKSNYLGH